MTDFAYAGTGTVDSNCNCNKELPIQSMFGELSLEVKVLAESTISLSGKDCKSLPWFHLLR